MSITYDENKNNKKYIGFTFDIEVIPPSQEQITELEGQFTKELASFLLEKIQKEVPETISYTDFFGEAENYLVATNQSWTLRKQVAMDMYKEFLSNLKKSIIYDEQEKCFYINDKFTTSLDYGDFYSPAYEIIRKLITRWLDEGHNTIRESKK